MKLLIKPAINRQKIALYFGVLCSVALGCGVLTGCVTGQPTEQGLVMEYDYCVARGPASDVVREEAREEAEQAVSRLQMGHFDSARMYANSVLKKDTCHPQARLVMALVEYIEATGTFAYRLNDDKTWELLEHSDNVRWHGILARLDEQLEQVERDLAIASTDPEISIELCMACWEQDWDRDGRQDPFDAHLFQLELDEKGELLPEDDPRRTPTFRFDLGDIYWARAFLSFQRALVSVGLAYDFEIKEEAHLIRIYPTDKSRAVAAQKLILSGIELSRRCRTEYLAETDDDWEWVPNPNQKDHPVPLTVNADLYETWIQVLGDVELMMKSEEGIDIAEFLELVEFDIKDGVPSGYLDLGGMLTDPGEIILNWEHLFLAFYNEGWKNLKIVLEEAFGAHYKAEMKPTQLFSRFKRMKEEIENGEETLEYKLKYLLWLN